MLAAAERFVRRADLDDLYSLVPSIPADKPLLRPLRLLAMQTFVARLRVTSTTEPVPHRINLAAGIHNLAIELGDLGRRGEALTAAQESVSLYREMAEDNRDNRGPLARSLNTLGATLEEIGRRTEALRVSQEALELCRDLVAEDRGAHLPHLALSLYNFSIKLDRAGRHDEALATAEEAVTLRRELAELDRNTHLPALAGSLFNLARWNHEAGRRAQGQRLAQDARDLYRELANNDPERFEKSATFMDAHIAELTKES